jgi:hypothetical protein
LNLTDIVGGSVLSQDDWSSAMPRFGEDNRLCVMGWSGKTVNGSRGNKLYIVKCDICSQDPELFGEGYFRIRKAEIKRNQMPCGCSRNPHWTKEQYIVLCKRKAEELGYTFLGFEGEWKGHRTKIRMLCEKHGEWGHGIINGFLNSSQACTKCGYTLASELKLKPDEVMIASFFASGAFHSDTKFWRSDRQNSQGCKVYWFMACPECSEVGESQSNGLQMGQRPCGCSKNRQRQAYVNLIEDGNTQVAIKFGIANNSLSRIKVQDRLSVYSVRQHSVYTFPNVTSCKQAERECKEELECGIVLKRDFPDGYTETTWVYNLDKIIEIYERNGGIKI